jgi:uncharacterized protein YdaU (DUF1376 family)
MKHYPHHIGDFDKATRHLTRIERSVYRDLIDLYYDTEQRLTLDVQALCRRIIARTNEESTAVQQVLNEFFTETPTGWYHDRCEAEIEAYRANTSQKAMAGKASAEAKRLKNLQALNEPSTAVQQPLNPVATDCNGTPTNHQPSTINQEPFVRAAEAASTTPSKKGRRLPDEWQLPKSWGEWALGEYPAWTADIVRLEAAKFSDHWHAKAGKDASKTDWEATWRNWCRSPICQEAHSGKPSFSQQAADVARSTVPSRQGRDPVLIEREQHEKFGAAPIPPAIREKMAALKGGVLQ